MRSTKNASVEELKNLGRVQETKKKRLAPFRLTETYYDVFDVKRRDFYTEKTMNRRAK